LRIMVITGMSGSGKTNVMRFFEDQGYFCVDNMPPILIPKLLEVFSKVGAEKGTDVAVAVDMRMGDMIEGLLEQIKELRESGYKCELLFLDAKDDVLVKRYKETRRVHPIPSSNGLLDSIKTERVMLSDLYSSADYVVDTSDFTINDMYHKLKGMFEAKSEKENIHVNIIAFGFKYGVPLDADLVFDLRCFPNPFYIDELRKKTGNDKEVQDYVLSFETSREFLTKLIDMVMYLLPLYMDEGRMTLTVAVGCTGGRHRSVTMANKLHDALAEAGYSSDIYCRDIARDK